MQDHARRDPNLFTPVEVGSLTLRNRVVMAPLTRSRAGRGTCRLSQYRGSEQGYTNYPILREVAPDVCYRDAERAWG